MSEKKKETKCCGCCKSKVKELSNEDLEKVKGGEGWAGLGQDAHLVNGYYICNSWKNKWFTCKRNKTIDNIPNVCTCGDKKNGVCCRVYGDNCTCGGWNKAGHYCEANE